MCYNINIMEGFKYFKNDINKKGDLPTENKFLNSIGVQKSTKNLVEKNNELNNVFETDFYDINPEIELCQKNKDVSYRFNGETFERKTNLYKDSNGNFWYEITKDPEKQMAVSLLAQSFFHISPVVKIEKEKGFLGKKIDKLNPIIKDKVLCLKKYVKPEKELFLSKELNFNNLPKKEKEKIMGEYVVFCSIFEMGVSDRSLLKSHNIRSSKDSYALFDFDNSGVYSTYELKQEKVSEHFDYFIGEIKYIETKKDGYSFQNEPLSFITLKTIGLKIKEMIDFFSKNEGEEFFTAVLDKTNYMNKEIKLDGSITVGDIYKKFTQKILMVGGCFVDEFNKFKNFYSEEEQADLEELKNFFIKTPQI